MTASYLVVSAANAGDRVSNTRRQLPEMAAALEAMLR